MRLDKFTTLEQLAAAIRTLFGFGKFGVHARVYNSSDIALANATPVYLTFDSERWDTDGIHDTVSNTGRLTAQRSGWYIISGHVMITANTSGLRLVGIRFNGTTAIAEKQDDPPATGECFLNLTTQYYLSAGEYVEMFVLQTSGTTLYAIANSNYSPEFMMSRIA